MKQFFERYILIKWEHVSHLNYIRVVKNYIIYFLEDFNPFQKSITNIYVNIKKKETPNK